MIGVVVGEQNPLAVQRRADHRRRRNHLVVILVAEDELAGRHAVAVDARNRGLPYAVVESEGLVVAARPIPPLQAIREFDDSAGGSSQQRALFAACPLERVRCGRMNDEQRVNAAAARGLRTPNVRDRFPRCRRGSASDPDA